MTKELYLMNLLMILTMITILFFISMNLSTHPIIIIIILLLFSMITCLNISMWKSNYLYSIILFLIMISGMLIIFLYFTSLISNEKINLKFNYPMLIPFFTNSILFLILNSYTNYLIYIPHNYMYLENMVLQKLNTKFYQNILTLYEYPYNNLTIMSMFYLLMSLFIVIKICSYKSMMLRKIN